MALCIVAVIAIVFFLRAAKLCPIPVALAVLSSYALAPVMSWLERHRVHDLDSLAWAPFSRADARHRQVRRRSRGAASARGDD